MASRIKSLRADEVEVAVWEANAVRLGVSFNAWARRALNDQLGLDESLRVEDERASVGVPVEGLGGSSFTLRCRQR